MIYHFPLWKSELTSIFIKFHDFFQLPNDGEKTEIKKNLLRINKLVYREDKSGGF
jgi:hypothetical protein